MNNIIQKLMQELLDNFSSQLLHFRPDSHVFNCGMLRYSLDEYPLHKKRSIHNLTHRKTNLGNNDVNLNIMAADVE